MITESAAYTQRPIAEAWDNYDSIFYNAWQKVDILPTRFVDMGAMRSLGIDAELDRLFHKIGLGTMPTRQFDLYPDLVRQCLATVRVYYTGAPPHIAQQVMLTFLIRGVRYRVSFLELCDIYGFVSDHISCAFPKSFRNIPSFWSYFGDGVYDCNTTTQMDIRHPVLRCLARTLSHTLLCKMEPNKMRVSELVVLATAIGDIVSDAEYKCPGKDVTVNLGAVFAHHLESLKVKPFTSRGKAEKTAGRKKTESVGSLLTPIFQHLGISTSSCRVVSSRDLMDLAHFEHLRWLRPVRQWVFSTYDGDCMVQLPNTQWTNIGNDPFQLLFTPTSAVTVRAPVTRRRGTPLCHRHTAIGRIGAPSHTNSSFSLPTPPAMNFDPFQRYVVDSFQTILTAISRLQASQDPTTPQSAGPSRYAGDDTSDED